MTNYNTNITGDFEIQNQSNLAFEMPPIEFGTAETQIDEFNATQYLGARFTVSLTNDLGQIELNEFIIIHDKTNAFIQNVSTVNNLASDLFVGSFRVVLVNGFVRILVTALGTRNIAKCFKIMFKQ